MKEKIHALEIGSEKIGAVEGGKKISVRASVSKIFEFIDKVRLIVVAAG